MECRKLQDLSVVKPEGSRFLPCRLEFGLPMDAHSTPHKELSEWFPMSGWVSCFLLVSVFDLFLTCQSLSHLVSLHVGLLWRARRFFFFYKDLRLQVGSVWVGTSGLHVGGGVGGQACLPLSSFVPVGVGGVGVHGSSFSYLCCPCCPSCDSCGNVGMWMRFGSSFGGSRRSRRTSHRFFSQDFKMSTAECVFHGGS